MNQPAIIAKAGEQILKKSSEKVDNFGSKELQDLVDYLFYNMKHYDGVGIAAPQIGENKRVLVYGFTANPRYPSVPPVAKTVLINPEIYYFSKEKNDFYEGCLSIPNIRGLVQRANTIHVQAKTLAGELIDKQASGFEARIIQHEVDHLNGILFPERMSDLKTLIYNSN